MTTASYELQTYNDHRTTAHNPGKPTGDEERPAQPAVNDNGRPQTQMTTTTTLN